MTRQHDSGAKRLGQEQLVTRLQAGLAEDPAGIRQPGDREAKRCLGCLGAMAADQCATVGLEDFRRALQHRRKSTRILSRDP